MRQSAARPTSTRDLSPAERGFVTVLQQLGFGHLESVKVHRGAIVLDPRPTVVKVLKFGASDNQPPFCSADFGLKKAIAELFEYIRGVGDGEIRRLEVRHGLPFSMEVEHRISRGLPGAHSMDVAGFEEDERRHAGALSVSQPVPPSQQGRSDNA